MSRNYYYLVAGLPELFMEQNKRPFDLAAFKAELREFLHPDDFSLVEVLFLPYDHLNLLSLLQKKNTPFHPLGKFSADELEEEIREPLAVPSYFKNFIERFREEADTPQDQTWENQLTELYYDHASSCSNPFIRTWFGFEKNLRNILTAYTCRKFGMAADHELVGQGEFVESLKKSQARDFGLSGEVDFMDRLLSILDNPNLFEREKGLDLLRWNYLDELNTFHYFTIEVILAYVIKLLIIERWLILDRSTGEQLFRQFLEDLRSSYEFPTEYTTHERR
ncbi:MAG: DUF2764 family protein [Bacteroidales bacterium]|nr:DUF2764 family protein [Lentimicrobiaceae bacterium]MDD5696106.1 DUF2764 family protein [Bacteroidales bacterium]